MAYNNADGLRLKFGTEKATTNKVGEYVTTGALRTIELKIDLTALTTTEAIQGDVTVLGAGYRVEQVDVIGVVAATTSTSAALNIGLVRTDRTTVYDADGLVEALAVTSLDAAGERTTLVAPVAGTAVGDLVGTTLANSGYITASTSTGTFTAGSCIVRIHYMNPA